MFIPFSTGLDFNGRVSYRGKLIRGWLWDLDGTQVNREPLFYAAHVEIARMVGVFLDPRNFQETIARVRNFYGGPGRAIMEQLYVLGNKSLTVEKMLEADAELFRQLMEAVPNIEPRPGLRGLLDMFQEYQIPLGLCTVTNQADAEMTLEKTGLDRYFSKELRVFRHHVDNLKPAPDVFRVAGSRMGIPMSEIGVTEDSPVGIQAAVASEAAVVIGMPVDARPEVVEHLRELGAHEVHTGYEPFNDLIEAARNLREGRGDGSLSYQPLGVADFGYRR